jgi:hypothetical protein
LRDELTKRNLSRAVSQKDLIRVVFRGAVKEMDGVRITSRRPKDRPRHDPTKDARDLAELAFPRVTASRTPQLSDDGADFFEYLEHALIVRSRFAAASAIQPKTSKLVLPHGFLGQAEDVARVINVKTPKLCKPRGFNDSASFRKPGIFDQSSPMASDRSGVTRGGRTGA